MLAAILAPAGPTLTPDERAFFRDADPAGYILFRRNCENRAQLKALTDSLRELGGRTDLPILIDQEGGRVARMRPPEWPELPPAGRFAELYRHAPVTAIEATRHNAAAIAALLGEVGINVNCLPLLDVRQEGASDIMGDRTLGAEPMQVAALGRAVLDGLREGGVLGVIKHMPGHGRAVVDSHETLPVVDVDEDALEIDLEPFVRLHQTAMGMTAHVVYDAWDRERPASLSPIVIEAIIRGRIGFDGFLMSDDIGMGALAGSFGERAYGVVAAGCDAALHCSGDMAEMLAVAGDTPALSEAGSRRLASAMTTITDAPAAVYADAAAKRDALLTAIAV